MHNVYFHLIIKFNRRNESKYAALVIVHSFDSIFDTDLNNISKLVETYINTKMLTLFWSKIKMF